jgi:hypothetical protein
MIADLVSLDPDIICVLNVIYYRSTTLEKKLYILLIKSAISRLFNYDEKYFYSLSLLILLILF